MNAPIAIANQEEIKTTCAYCGVGCGVITTIDPDKKDSNQALIVRGDENHPANYGKLCVKGSALGETVHLHNRLLRPHIKGQAVDWESATSYIANKLRDITSEHGPKSCGFYVSGQLLTEDYYIANKLAKGYIGTPNIDTNSRLCMSSAVSGHKRAFGTDTVPNSYEDFELADLIVLVGSNTAWCHPILFQRIKAYKQNNPSVKVVVIDPRKTATCEIADLHLAINPGADVLLFNTVLAALKQRNKLNTTYIESHTDNFDKALALAESDASQANLADSLGFSEQDLNTFIDWFCENDKTMTLFSQGVNQSNQGTNKVNAILNCHLATGRIGKPGSGPFSMTGQPNAMGGREVGGLATVLAAHLELGNADHRQTVQDFWQSPTMINGAGLTAVDFFDAVYDGKIKAVWIMATNPIVSLPNADKVREALKRCPLVIVSEVLADTDCGRLADVILPAQGWSEKDGTVTNSERVISRQRNAITPVGESKPDWWIMCEVAKKMGFDEGFNFNHQHEIFIEHAQLSAFKNNEQEYLRDFDISGLATLNQAQYNALEPIQWPVYKQHNPENSKRFFSEGNFYTANRKGQFIAVQHLQLSHPTSPEFPFILNSGRLRDQWHTMTRTGQSARLMRHYGEPFVQLHPDDANALNISNREIIKIKSQWGEALAPALIDAGQKKANVFMPIHWNGVNSSASRVGSLVKPVTDPFSKQPDSKTTPVSIEKVSASHYGFMITSEELTLFSEQDYCVNTRLEQGFRQTFTATLDSLPKPEGIREQLNIPEHAEQLEYIDSSNGDIRLAWLIEDVFYGCFMLSPFDALPESNWLETMVGNQVSDIDRRVLLSGKASDPANDIGRIVCSCFGIGENTINTAIDEQGLKTVSEVGKCLKAGTNCGSCQSEIKELIALKQVN